MMPKYLQINFSIVFAFALACVCPDMQLSLAARIQSPVDILPIGVAISRELSPGHADSYIFPVNSGQYFSLRVEQLGVDVVVTLYGPEGQLIEEFDTPNGDKGPEVISGVADMKGTYKVEVRAIDRAMSGSYQIKLQEIRDADSEDKRRIEARNHIKELKNALQQAIDAGNDKQLIQSFEDAARELKKPRSEPIGLSTVVQSAIDLPLTILGNGDITRAASLAEQLLRVTETVFGANDPFFASNLTILGEISFAAGDIDRALDLANRARAIADKLGGDYYASFLLDFLARIYQHQGKYEDSEIFFRRALNALNNTLGPEDLGTTRTTSNLAYLYIDLGRYDEAEVLFLRVIGIEERLRPQTEALAATLNGLGVVYLAKDKEEEAEPLFRQAVTIFEKTLGPQNPSLASALGNLAETYSMLHRYDEAEQAMEQALAIKEKVLGPDHPSMASGFNNLAGLFARQHKTEEAEKYYLKALAIREKALGPEHPDVATVLANLAAEYADHKRYDEAEPLFTRALSIQKKTLGPNHPKLAWLLETWSDMLRAQGKEEEAGELEKQAEEIRRRQK